MAPINGGTSSRLARLVNQSSGLYADVTGASTANGAAVIERSGPGGTNQQWRLIQV